MGGQRKEAGFTCVELWPLALDYDVVYISSLELYPERAVTCPCIPREGETMLK